MGTSIKHEVTVNRLKEDKNHWKRLKKESPRKLIPILDARDRKDGVASWSKPTIVEVGAFFINLLVKTAKISSNPNPNLIGKAIKPEQAIDAFERLNIPVITNQYRLEGVVRCHDIVNKLLQEDFSRSEAAHPRVLYTTTTNSPDFLFELKTVQKL